MLKTKVTCWFCNQECQVFFMNKNSWTCGKCEQYNGFKKDGDYNKPIPEMQKEVNKHYCANSNQNYASSGSLLCEQCNRNQEMKLNEMKNFEEKMDDKTSDKEYEMFKKRLDHLYDLCRPCKMKVNYHLKNIDLQIGDNLIRQRKTINGSNANLHKPFQQINNMPKLVTKEKSQKIINQENSSPKLNKICDNLKNISKKAYTIAGTVPNYVFKTSPTKESKYEISPASISKENIDTSFETSRTENCLSKVKSNRAKKSCITCDSITTIFEDILIFIFVVLVFACDLANVMNDSGTFFDENSTNGWLDMLLAFYRQIIVILAFVTILSMHMAYKRPKMSRFLMMFGYMFNLAVHFRIFDFRIEEQYITEVLISFFLTFYLTMARVYNLIQLVR
ncbi:transmembrane protein -like [Brachionus plicatilis]|uniref:Transmembrane protein-like n=1 Tax=Brachionus plicatilis TaxID=10195 RepID=A0A3M7PFI2_BRAPC|nr:transmembrane protein -like [Brachionus plicatilis]